VVLEGEDTIGATVGASGSNSVRGDRSLSGGSSGVATGAAVRSAVGVAIGSGDVQQAQLFSDVARELFNIKLYLIKGKLY